MKIRSIVLTLLTFALVTTISACGQKGPLRLPGAAAASATSAAPLLQVEKVRT